MTERKVVIPGEIIKEGNDFLPGDGTEKQGNNIIALKFVYYSHNKKIGKN